MTLTLLGDSGPDRPLEPGARALETSALDGDRVATPTLDPRAPAFEASAEIDELPLLSDDLFRHIFL